MYVYCRCELTVANGFSSVDDTTAYFILKKISYIFSNIYYSPTNSVNEYIGDTFGEELWDIILEEVNGFTENDLPLFWLTDAFCSETTTAKTCNIGRNPRRR